MPSPKPWKRRRFARLAIDRRGLTWPVTIVVLVAYVWLHQVTPSEVSITHTFVPLVALLLTVVAAQWVLVHLSHRLVLQRRWFQLHPRISMCVIAADVVLAGIIARTTLAGFPAHDVVALQNAETLAMHLQRIAVFLAATGGWAMVSDYRLELAKERALRTTLAAERAAGIARVQEQRSSVVEQISAMLQAGLRDITTSTDAPRALLALARERIRPLSHELARSVPAYESKPPKGIPTPPWRVVLMNITSRPIVRPKLMAFAVLGMFFWQTGSFVSSSEVAAGTAPSAATQSDGVSVSLDLTSLLRSLAYLALIFGVTWAVGSILVRISASGVGSTSLVVRVMWLLSTPLVVAITVEAAIQLAFVSPGPSESLHRDLGQRIALTLPIFVIAVVLLLVRAAEELLESGRRQEQALNAELQWEIARANETLVQERRFLANTLHGPLQSQVSSAAIALASAEDETATALAWQRVRESLNTSVRAIADGPNQERSLATELEVLGHTWKGLCEIETQWSSALREQLDRDWITAGTISDVLTEAVANAVMHGGATHVEISLEEREGPSVDITVRDNGQASKPAAEPGLGSTQLDEIAITWHRDFADTGTTLHVAVPLAATR